MEAEDRFIVNPKLVGSLLSPAEVELLNRIVIIGFYSKRIQNFIERYGGISTKLALQIAYSGQNPDHGEEAANRSNEAMSNNGEENAEGEAG